MARSISLNQLVTLIGLKTAEGLKSAIARPALKKYLESRGIGAEELNYKDLHPNAVVSIIRYYAIDCAEGYRRPEAIAHHHQIETSGYEAWSYLGSSDGGEKENLQSITEILNDWKNEIETEMEKIRLEYGRIQTEKKERQKQSRKNSKLKKKGEPIPDARKSDEIKLRSVENKKLIGALDKQFNRLRYERLAINEELERCRLGWNDPVSTPLRQYPVYKKLVAHIRKMDRLKAAYHQETQHDLSELSLLDDAPYISATRVIEAALKKVPDKTRFTLATAGTKTTSAARKIYSRDRTMLASILSDLVLNGELVELESMRKDSKVYAIAR